MAEVREFALPDLGEGLTEAEIVRWLVEVGDTVTVDQPVVEVETAKAMVEVPCPYAGVVTARHGDEGAAVPVGAPLVTVAVGTPSHAASHPPAQPDTPRDGGPTDSAPAAAAPGNVASGNVLVGYGTRGVDGAQTRRRRVRPPAASGQAAATVPGARPASAPERSGPVAVVSPLVRRLAREHRLDLRTIRGSGPHGLILRADVERAVRAAQPGTTPPPPRQAEPQLPPQDRRHGERVPLRGVRGAAAERLSRSRREIPDATCWVDADATELLAARRAMNTIPDRPPVPLLALLARICTAALARFPELNATVDTATREIVRLPEVHLGFAAQTERGLVVPVVRDAHAKDTETLSAELARLTEAARAGTLAPGELTGGTFTLNNYGVFGVDGSTPILNHPEAAMLGVGHITEKPWVHRGELAVRHVVQLSLTFDHRVCDGGTAGGFLRYVADCVEQPAVLLRTL